MATSRFRGFHLAGGWQVGADPQVHLLMQVLSRDLRRTLPIWCSCQDCFKGYGSGVSDDHNPSRAGHPRAGNPVIAPTALASRAHGFDGRSTEPGSRRLVADSHEPDFRWGCRSFAGCERALSRNISLSVTGRRCFFSKSRNASSAKSCNDFMLSSDN
jgi:hypothetical protein